ncbi:MAG: IS4 family transposase [Firmicutes bacterium]|nr:IS4 family transposase [Bacillota bacterium]
MKPKILREILQREIDSLDVSECAKDPSRDFSRTRKLPLNVLVTTMLHMEGQSVGNELLSIFPKSKETPSPAAFVQQRSKLNTGVFDALFHSFVQATEAAQSPKTLHGMRLLAVDGSDIHIPTDLSNEKTLCVSKEGQTPHNMMHLNAMYDLLQRTYVDEIVQNYREMNENSAFVEMVDRSRIDKALVMADRNYESFNSFAHVIEKGWYFLIRVKDVGSSGMLRGLDLPDEDCFDVGINLNLTRKQTKAVKELLHDRNHYRFIPPTATFDYLPARNRKAEPTKWYPLSFRIVRFPISEDSYEAIITNLPADEFPSPEIKSLYAMRWGIETSFRALKYTIGLLYFHSKKAEYIRHEIAARLIMYNFFELITTHVIVKTKNRKYSYKANFNRAVHICRMFLRGDISPPDVEAQIARNIVPIRPDRQRNRERLFSSVISFAYRLS